MPIAEPMIRLTRRGSSPRGGILLFGWGFVCKLKASANRVAVIARGENGGLGRWLRCPIRGRQAIPDLAVRPDSHIAPPRHITPPFAPASVFFKIPMTCSSANLVRFIVHPL